MRASAAETLTSRITESLLSYLSEPSRVIRSVKEEILLDRYSVASRSEIILSNSIEEDVPYRYIDVVHPNKGTQVYLKVETDGVEVLSHSEHERVAREAINYRFSSVVNSLSFIGEDDLDPLLIHQKLGEVRSALEEIPSLPSWEAIEVFKKYFAEQSSSSDTLPTGGVNSDGKWPEEHGWIQMILKEVKASAAYSSDPEMTNNLRRLLVLCKRLTRRYLLLLRVPQGTKSITLIQERPYQTQGMRDQDEKVPRKYLFFGSVPTEFRYHVPWAKKTDHYQLTARAPYGQFFATAKLVSRGVNSRSIYELGPSSKTAVSWSLSLNRGDRLMAFIGKGRLSVRPLFVAITHREAPGRSLLRAITLAAVSLIMMSTLFCMQVLLKVSVKNLGSILVGIIALGGLASPWPKDQSPMGIPLLSRVTPGVVACILVPYVVWLMLQPNGAEDPAVATCLGMICCLLMFVFNLRLLYRLKNQYIDRKTALLGKPVVGGAFLGKRGGV